MPDHMQPNPSGSEMDWSEEEDADRVVPALITRRSFLGTSAALTSYALLGVPDKAGAPSDQSSEALPGRIDRIELPRTLYVHNSLGSAIITITDSTHFYRAESGQVDGLSAYLVGDEIVAEGQWVDATFVATALVTLHRLVDGHVISRRGDALETTGGPIRLTPDTVPVDGPDTVHGPDVVAEPITEIGAKHIVRADGWRDPSTGDLVAVRIGVMKRV